jgi:UDP-N-acetylglucosamine 2-epimerase (non-hydrolysing)
MYFKFLNSNMKKILLVFGTRPEAIKMCPIILELLKNKEVFDTYVCVTGQHREMLDQVLDVFGIKPDFDLNVMKPGQDLFDITSKILVGIKSVFENVKPDLVLVHGDTTTSTAVALGAFYKQIKLGHVEAGLRTNNKFSPWPEEMNRCLTGKIADFHFAPTELSYGNLINENVSPSSIFVTGNTVIDALFYVLEKIKNVDEFYVSAKKTILQSGYDINRLSNRELILITGHRRENFGNGFRNICNAIKELAIKYPGIDFVYPMHLNPNVRNAISEVFDNFKLDNLFFIEPLDYIPFVLLMSKSKIILTDSGGIQEEAPSLGIPVLVMRDTTERPEAVNSGTVKLVGTDRDKIIKEISLLIDDKQVFDAMSSCSNPYGGGDTSKKIIENLKLIL